MVLWGEVNYYLFLLTRTNCITSDCVAHRDYSGCESNFPRECSACLLAPFQKCPEECLRFKWCHDGISVKGKP